MTKLRGKLYGVRRPIEEVDDDDDDNCNLELFSKTTGKKDEKRGRDNLQSSSSGHGGGATDVDVKQ